MLPAFAINTNNRGFPAANHINLVSSAAMFESHIIVDFIAVGFECYCRDFFKFLPTEEVAYVLDVSAQVGGFYGEFEAACRCSLQLCRLSNKRGLHFAFFPATDNKQTRESLHLY